MVVHAVLRLGVGGMIAVLVPACSGRAPAAARTSAQQRPSTCVRDVTYWVNEQLAGRADASLDYQEMGLAGSTYDMALELVGAHRSARLAAPQVTSAEERRAAAMCAARTSRVARPAADNGRVWPAG